MNIKIATWNINSIRLREDQVCSVLNQHQPDIICLQELKSATESVPTSRFENLGYKYRVIRGQKSYNGVAIISRIPFMETGSCDYCSKGDARHVFARLNNGVEIQNFYVPAGGDIADRESNEKFAHKLDFLQEMKNNFFKKRLSKTIIVGDFNIVPNESDASNFSSEDILCSDKERNALKSLFDLGLIDCYTNVGEESPFTWWDYRGGAFHKDIGYRIDLLLASRETHKSLKRYEVHKDTRHKSWCPEQPKTSDHAPVMIEF